MWANLVALVAKLGVSWTRRRRDVEIQGEMDAHLELLAERYVRQGMTRAAAERAARQQFGNAALVREEARATNGFRWIDSAVQDVRYAARQIRRSPGFSAVVVATLALGIGGTTAVFSVVQSVLLAPLPYDQPGQLVRIYQEEPGNPATRSVVSATHFKALREQASSFDVLAAIYLYSEVGRDLIKDGRAERLRVLPVSSGYFETFRAQPVRGRTFEQADETGARRVVLSDRLWRARFGADSSIIGQTVLLNAEPYEVIGVAAAGFRDVIAGDVDAWLPQDLAGDTEEQNYSLVAVGRVRSGTSLDQARAELAALSRGMKERWPAARLSAIVALPLKEDVVSPARGVLFLLLVAVALVLIVACVNAAGLVLVRSTGRVQEFAIRAALGSGRGRIVHQLLVENALVAGLGGLAGLAVAALGVAVLRTLGSGAFPRVSDVGLNPVVLAFAATMTMGSLIGFGVLPAVRFARVSPADALRQQSRSATGSRAERWLRNGLAAAQIALALTLLSGAAVLVASFQRLAQVPLGFRADRALTFEINLPTARYDPARRALFQEELARTLATIPGVKAAGGISRLPATGGFHPWNTTVESGPRAGTSISRGRGFNIQQRTISGNIFTALDIPVLAGRTFDDRDAAGTPGRAVVSANFARQAFADQPFDGVIGQRIRTVGSTLEIIGVVGDVTMDVYGVPTLVVYHAHRQFADNRNWTLTQVVAADLPPDALLAAARTRIAALDPELVVHKAAPLADVVGRGASRERFALVLMGTFAVVSLTLAALGLYGVLAYAVRQRTQEIGIRMALGATASQVGGLVLGQAGLVVGLGLVIGIAGALSLGRWLRALAFQVSPSDPRIIGTTAVLLIVVALIAAWLPARRASRVSPKIAMTSGE